MAPPELCSTRVSALTPARSLQGELHLTISPNFCEPMCIPPYGKQVLKFVPALFIYFFLITQKLKALTTLSTKSIVPSEKGSRLLPVLRSSGLVSLPCTDAVRLQKGCAMLLAPAMLQGHARQCELLSSPRWGLLHSGLAAHTQLTAQRARLGWQGGQPSACTATASLVSRLSDSHTVAANADWGSQLPFPSGRSSLVWSHGYKPSLRRT